ncbi:MAG TPA: PaaI family thioesterase [Acidimicrobiales bacterium]|nr:PaaI family thioesterase [Acidimicrobiales bacterium]
MGPGPDDELGVSDFGISFRGGGAPAVRQPEPDVRFRLADEIRRVTSAMVGLPIGDDDIEAATEALGALATRLEAAAGPGRRMRAQPDPVGHPQDFFPTSPVIGFANPVAPPVTVEAVDGELRGTAFFDYQYEGPPTCVHGGVIAMVFDELLGAANIMAGTPAMTGTLTITYRKPTPLRTALRLEARCVGKEGRKVRTYGAIFHGDVLTAEAEGIFIELVPQRFLAIVSENAEGSDAVEQVRADARRLGFAESDPP